MEKRPNDMDKAPIEINDIIQVRRLADEESSFYRSRVNDIVNDKMVIYWPTDAGIRMPIREERGVEVIFIRRDAAYSFEAIVDRCAQTPIPQVTLHQTGLTRRIQRRSYFRIPTSVPAQLAGSVEANTATGEKREDYLHLVTHTVNLGGSGMAICHKSTLPIGTVFNVKVTLEANQAPIKLLARVVHSEALSSGSNIPIYHIGLDFLAVSEPQRKFLVRYCFREQQKLLSQQISETANP